MTDSERSTESAKWDPEAASSMAEARAEHLASFVASSIETDDVLGTADEPWSMTARAAGLLAPFRSAKIGDPALAFAALEYVGIANRINDADPRQMTPPTFEDQSETPTKNALTAPYVPFLSIAVLESGARAEPVAPKAIASSEAVARVLERWRKSSRKNEAVSLALAVEALKTLADAHHIADAWGGSDHWKMPYEGADPFLGMLDVVTNPRQVGEVDLREVMELACVGAADRIIGAADRIDSDYQALVVAARGERDTPSDRIPELVEALGTALTTEDKYEALRSIFKTNLTNLARDFIVKDRNRGNAIAKVQTFKPLGRLFVGGVTPEHVANMLVEMAASGETVNEYPWIAKVRNGNDETVERPSYIRIITQADFSDRLRALGRVRSIDILSVGYAYQQAWENGYESSGQLRFIPVPLNQVVSALMANESPSTNGRHKSKGHGAKDGARREPRKQGKMKAFVRGIVDAIRTVQIEWRAWDTESESYQEVYTKLIDVIGFGTYKDARGHSIPNTWLSSPDPIALFTNRALSKKRVLPLPGTEPFDLDDCALYNQINLRLETLDWMVEYDKGPRGPVKEIRMERDELINGGTVAALEGSTRTSNAKDDSAEVDAATLRKRRVNALRKRWDRALDGCKKRLPKVSAAILAAREDQGLPKVEIEPEYVKTGNNSVPTLNAIILRGRRDEASASKP